MQSLTLCHVTAPHGIFGVPLQQSVRYANVAISLFNDEGQSYIYGYVPIVVAKCGVFLKEKGEVKVSSWQTCDTKLTFMQQPMLRVSSAWREARSASKN